LSVSTDDHSFITYKTKHVYLSYYHIAYTSNLVLYGKTNSMLKFNL